jgi:N-methylhydantoinase B
MTIRHERVKFPPRGLLGGLPGSAGRDYVNGEAIDAKVRMDLQPDDVVMFETPGGGGLGPPAKREAAMLEDDLRSGLVTPEGARAYRSTARTGDARGD